MQPKKLVRSVAAGVLLACSQHAEDTSERAQQPILNVTVIGEIAAASRPAVTLLRADNTLGGQGQLRDGPPAPP